MEKNKIIPVKSFFAFICICLISIQAESQDADTSSLVIHGFKNQLVILKNASCYIDSASLYSFEKIKQQNFGVPYQTFFKKINSDPGHSAFWLKLTLENRIDSSLQLFLYCGDVNYIDIYAISGYTSQLVTGGNLRPSKHRSLAEEPSLILPLKIAPHQATELFVRIKQLTQEFDFDGIEIYDQANLNSSMLKDYEYNQSFIIFQFLFQGFLVCQIIYTLFQWLIIRRKEYLYYSFYLLVIAVYYLSKYESLYGIPILFTRYPVLKVYLGKTLLILPYFLYFKFVSAFLELPEKYPPLHKWIRYMENFLLVYMVFDFILIVSTLNQKLQTTVFTIVLFVVFIITALFIFYMFRQKQKLIYYILTGSLFAAAGNITGLVFTFLSDNYNIDFGFHNFLVFSKIGVLLEIICFTAGLSYKSKKNEEEKISGQQQLIEQLKANEQLQSNMQNIRNKIAQDLHDDIGSTLSSISILSDLALKEKDSAQTAEAIHEIKDNSITLMEKMDDIVWSINPKNDSLENLLMRIRRFATALFEAKEIDYSISIYENIAEIKLPVDYRQHIYLILKEAVNNLIKYSGATKALIEVGLENNILTLKVSDNGKGFLPEYSTFGNGILSMRSRAQMMNAHFAIHSVINEGTEIILQVLI